MNICSGRANCVLFFFLFYNFYSYLLGNFHVLVYYSYFLKFLFYHSYLFETILASSVESIASAFYDLALIMGEMLIFLL